MIFTTPNKENKTLQLHPPSNFFLFFLCKFPAGFHVCIADWRAADHVFIDSFQSKQLVPHGLSYGRKDRSCITL